MGNEVSRRAGSDDLIPQGSSVASLHSPCTPSGRRNQSFNLRTPSPSPGASASLSQRRTSSTADLSSTSCLNSQKERTIQLMDKAIRHRVRGGITYNMKLLIRGAKGTGKTSLFQRLKGEPIPETHEFTTQLQCATISWKLHQNVEDNIKCEVWDVVDKGFEPVEVENKAKGGSRRYQFSEGKDDPKKGHSGTSLSAGIQSTTHATAIVDASTVDVYHEAHGVIFLLNITKWDTLEYVKTQLNNVPVHIPTLVLGNFRDQGALRKIYQNDIQDLLYGSSDRPQPQQWRRPTELQYFECSLFNCYGLTSLHQYLGIPFLHLKLATIRQQMRLVDGEFTQLKHDVQTTICQQRYAEYVEHIKATGSDIRTGRRGSETPPAVSKSTSLNKCSNAISHTTPTTQQASANEDGRVVEKAKSAIHEPPTDAAAVAVEIADVLQQEQETAQMQDIDHNVPTRVEIQSVPRPEVEHKEIEKISFSNDAPEIGSKVENKLVSGEDECNKVSVLRNDSSSPSPKALMEGVMLLEDFQVPKTRISELDHFYSEDESDKSVDAIDEDVVVVSGHRVMKSKVSGAYHKQRFLDSDSSESDGSDTVASQHLRKKRVLRKTSSRHTATQQVNTVEAAPMVLDSCVSLHSPTTTVSRSKSHSRPTPSVQRHRHSSRGKGQINVLPNQQQAVSPTSGQDGVVPDTSEIDPLTTFVRHASPRHKSSTSIVKIPSENRVSLSEVDGEAAQVALMSDNCSRKGTHGAVESKLESKRLLPEGQVSSPRAHCLIVKAVEESNTSISLVTTSPVALSAFEDQTSKQPGTTCPDSLGSSWTGAESEAAFPVNIAAHSRDDDGSNTPAVSQDHEAEAENMSRSLDDHDGSCQRYSPRSRDALVPLLQASFPMPEASASLFPLALASLSALTQSYDARPGHYHKQNHIQATNLLSLSTLQPSLAIPNETATSILPVRENITTLIPCSVGTDDSKAPAARHLSELHTITLNTTVPDCANVGFSTDLETFLNESDSDVDNAPPSTNMESSGGYKHSKGHVHSRASDRIEASEDDNEEDLERFASYSISKKSRSDRRHQQKEDLRRLHDALGPIAPSTSGIALSDSSFGTSDVIEAIRKAQEEALRMLFTNDTTVLKPKHKKKDKQQEHKQKKRKGKKETKSSRRTGLSSRSLARHSNGGDLM